MLLIICDKSPARIKLFPTPALLEGRSFFLDLRGIAAYLMAEMLIATQILVMGLAAAGWWWWTRHTAEVTPEGI